MKTLILVMGVFFFAVGIGARAEAQNYPWCAQYSGRALGGAMNCGFVNFAQCMGTVSGIGGSVYKITHIDPSIIEPLPDRIHRLGIDNAILIEQFASLEPRNLLTAVSGQNRSVVQS